MTDRPALPHGVEPGGRFGTWRPARPRYVVCDVDGTLLGPDLHATDRVVAAVAAARDAGLRVGVATGRMRLAAAPLVEQLEADGPHVLHNGAEVRAEGRTVASWTLTSSQVDALLAIAAARDDLVVEIYTEDAYHVSSSDPRAAAHWEMLGRDPASVLDRAELLGGARVLKATFTVFDHDAVAEVIDAIGAAGLQAGPAGSPRTPHLSYVNATHPEADKGRALARASEVLGIDLAATVAVGDALNDLSMFAVAGTAVAMGQAEDEIKAASHLVVPEVAADGVAVALDAMAELAAPADRGMVGRR